MPELAAAARAAPDGRAEHRARTGRRSRCRSTTRSCRTGISAEERARTVRAIIDPATRPSDLVRPGHLFPLVAKEGGVLRRAGHTEATVDLARLAGPDARPACSARSSTASTSPAASGCTRSPREFSLPIVSIEMLISYRRRREKLVHRAGRGRAADALRPGPDHRLRRQARAGQRADRRRDGRPQLGRRPRWSGCTRRASPATCSTRSAATAATSSTWPSR